MTHARCLVALLLLLALPAFGEPEAQTPPGRLDYRTYLARVLAQSPELKAARATVDIARAQIATAKVFPDPQLTVGVLQFDLARENNPTEVVTQLSLPIELGGKRSRRIAVAQAGLRAAGHDYDASTRDLRTLAATAFIDALYARLVVAQKERALAHVERLVAVNERRFAAGDISQAALLQSRVEARQYRADVVQARGEQKAADLTLLRLLGDPAMLARTGLDLVGDLRTPPRPMDKAQLLASVERRPDVRAALTRVETAQRQVELEQAKRIVDISVSAGWQHNFAVGGTPGLRSADLLLFSLSVPLPFSRMYKGELEAARAAHRQAQGQLQAIRLRAEAELRQALARLDAAAERVATYETGILADALTVLEKTLYNYQRGGATMVELLIAQRTASDVHFAYLDALASRARALVAVAQAAWVAEDLVTL